MPKMADYRESLRRLAKEGSSDFINNSSIDHAAAMIEVLFDNAKGKAFVFSGHLNPDVYNRPELKQSVNDFLGTPTNEIHILLQSADTEDLKHNDFAIFLRDNYGKNKDEDNRVVFYKSKDKATSKLQNHFLVTKTKADNYAFRLELDIVNHIATGTFNGGGNGERIYRFLESQCIAANALNF